MNSYCCGGCEVIADMLIIRSVAVLLFFQQCIKLGWDFFVILDFHSLMAVGFSFDYCHLAEGCPADFCQISA